MSFAEEEEDDTLDVSAATAAPFPAGRRPTTLRDEVETPEPASDDLRCFWKTTLQVRISEAKNVKPPQAESMAAFFKIVVDDEVVAQTSTQRGATSPFFGDSFDLLLSYNFSLVSLQLFMQVFVELTRTQLAGRDKIEVTVVKARDLLFNSDNNAQTQHTFELRLGSTSHESSVANTRSVDTAARQRPERVVQSCQMAHEGIQVVVRPVLTLATRAMPCRHPMWDESLTVETDDVHEDLLITLWEVSRKTRRFRGQARIPVQSLDLDVRRLMWYRLGPRIDDFDETSSTGGTVRVFLKSSSELVLPESSYENVVQLVERGRGSAVHAIGRTLTMGYDWVQELSVHKPLDDFTFLGVMNALLTESKQQAGEALLPFDREDFARALMSTFVSRHSAVACLQALNAAEVQRATDPATLFRSNSLASKLPRKAAQSGVVRKHADHLIRYLDAILKAMFHTVSASPMIMRQVFSHLRQSVAANQDLVHRDKDAPFTAVSGFLFLRFFAPAVLNPKLFGMRDERPTGNVARTLTLLAKAITTIGNLGSALAGGKEPYMDPLRPIIEDSIDSARAYILAMSTEPSANERSSLMSVETYNKEEIVFQQEKVAVTDSATMALKKRSLTLSSRELTVNKRGNTELKIDVEQIRNVERVDADAFDRPYVVQLVLPLSTIYIDMFNAEQLETFLQVMRKILQASDAEVRTACHTGVYRKDHWTCCQGFSPGTLPCGKGHVTSLQDPL
ncbi:uncharacterized protein MONBRDRAFT_35609, partial [Monosiga brevicollis MX1]